MGVTSVTLGGLEINDNVNYAVNNDTLYLLEAMAPREAVLVDMANRPPVYVRSQIQARPVTIVVMLLNVNALTRKSHYDVMVAAADSALGMVELTWTDEVATRTLLVHVNGFIPSNWFSRASAEMIAPNPIPTT